MNKQACARLLCDAGGREVEWLVGVSAGNDGTVRLGFLYEMESASSLETRTLSDRE
jgi:hypothetical protein